MKKHISALVYVAITFIMLFGMQQLERSCIVPIESQIEVGNVKDRNIISILRTAHVVGHLPQ